MKLAERTFKRKDYYITSPFGYRRDPKTGVVKYHNGCDYGTNREKWKQYALENGIVTYAQKDSSGANVIIISYPRLKIELIYGHLDTIQVKKGQSVNKDTVIGTTGMTGYATGIHLHLGIRKGVGHAWEDPEKYDYIEEVIKPKLKSNEVIAKEVIDGKWGNQPERQKKLEKAGYNYESIRKIVNQLVTKKPTNTYSGKAYIVRKGDTLSGIAGMYKTTVAELVKKNKIKNPNLIYVGQKIIL